jgi:hypothetical protein
MTSDIQQTPKLLDALGKIYSNRIKHLRKIIRNYELPKNEREKIDQRILWYERMSEKIKLLQTPKIAKNKLYDEIIDLIKPLDQLNHDLHQLILQHFDQSTFVKRRPKLLFDDKAINLPFITLIVLTNGEIKVNNAIKKILPSFNGIRSELYLNQENIKLQLKGNNIPQFEDFDPLLLDSRKLGIDKRTMHEYLENSDRNYWPIGCFPTVDAVNIVFLENLRLIEMEKHDSAKSIRVTKYGKFIVLEFLEILKKINQFVMGHKLEYFEHISLIIRKEDNSHEIIDENYEYTLSDGVFTSLSSLSIISDIILTHQITVLSGKYLEISSLLNSIFNYLNSQITSSSIYLIDMLRLNNIKFDYSLSYSKDNLLDFITKLIQVSLPIGKLIKADNELLKAVNELVENDFYNNIEHFILVIYNYDYGDNNTEFLNYLINFQWIEKLKIVFATSRYNISKIPISTKKSMKLVNIENNSREDIPKNVDEMRDFILEDLKYYLHNHPNIIVDSSMETMTGEIILTSKLIDYYEDISIALVDMHNIIIDVLLKYVNSLNNANIDLNTEITIISEKFGLQHGLLTDLILDYIRGISSIYCISNNSIIYLKSWGEKYLQHL